MNPARSVKAISFDGDMTLWDFDKVMRHSLSLVLTELQRRVPGRRAGDLSIDKMIEIRNSVAADLKGKTVNLEEIRLHAFKRTVEFVGCADDALAADLNALYLEHRFEDIQLYPDVIPTLDALRPHFAIGLLSNGNSYPERCGLPERFSFVVFAQDVGVEKPDAGMFLAACKRAGCAPCELMHIGDSLESDVAGANGVGAISVWLNRDAKQNDSGIVPDHEIRSLAELADIVKRNGEASNKAAGIDEKPEMPLKAVTIRSRLGECPGKANGSVAFFDRADGITGKLIRHFVMLDRGVKLMYEPWGWRNEWYADIIRVDQVGDDVIELTDLCVDVVIEGDGPTYRVIDLDDVADAVASGAISREGMATALRHLQRFLDDHVHRRKDFPPTCIRPYLVQSGGARQQAHAADGEDAAADANRSVTDDE